MFFQWIVYSLLFALCFANYDETLLFCNTPPPKLANGLIKRDRVSYYTGQGYLGNMEYMCRPGFNLFGDKTVTCQNGVWTTMPRCILEKRCLPIQTYPANTMIESDNTTFFQNDPQQILVGSTVTLRCADHYELDPTLIGSLIIQCQNDGTWTTMPTCRYAQAMCDYSNLYLPAGSRITRMNFKFSEASRQLHVAGSNLEYNCEDGYRLNDGRTSLVVECLSSGSWSALPVCEFVYQTERTIRCTYPMYIQNGFITLYNVTIWEDQTYTGRMIYECSYGYETLDGKDQMESECVNGTWTKITDCQEIPTCPKQDLLQIESQVENSYVHNVSLQYTRDPLAFVYNSYVLRVCLPNFEHDPASPPLKIQCQRYTNTWTGIPICQVIPTTTASTIATEHEEVRMESENLLLLTNISLHHFQTTPPPMIVTEHEETRIQSEDFSFLTNSSLHYFATTPSMIATEHEEIHMESDDFSLITNSSPDQFQTTAVETESSTLAFESTPKLFCHSDDIPIIPNMFINQTELDKTYEVGKQLYFTCQLEYESLYNQSSFIVCSMNGTWTMDTIHLEMCLLKIETTEGILFDTSTIFANVTEEKNITGYFDEILPILNISNETFLASTHLSTVGNRQIRQATSYCKQFPQIEHGQLLTDDTIKYNLNNETTYSGSVLFVCQFGYRSDVNENEPFRITCQNNVFHPNVTCIEKPRCSLPPPIDSSRSSVVNSLINVFDTSTDAAIPGSFVSLNCFDKTTDEKSVFNMTCLDNGQWLLPPPPCTAPFKRRCQSGITIPNARTQIHAKLTTDGYFDDGSRATYRCLEHFMHDRQSGPLHLQCRNGRWGPRPRCVPNGCLEPLPDTIENGWKSAESYVIHGDTKYYLLTRYSCHDKALIVDSSARIIDIECRNGQWEHKVLPACQLQE